MYENLKELLHKALQLQTKILTYEKNFHHPQTAISLKIYMEEIIDKLKEEVEWKEVDQ